MKLDIDECSGSNNCATGGTSTCTNTAGSYTCACNTGYSGNGVTCSGNVWIQALIFHSPSFTFLILYYSFELQLDNDECLGQGSGNNCHAQATCTNTIGSFACACKDGYDGSGVNCTG